MINESHRIEFKIIIIFYYSGCLKPFFSFVCVHFSFKQKFKIQNAISKQTKGSLTYTIQMNLFDDYYYHLFWANVDLNRFPRLWTWTNKTLKSFDYTPSNKLYHIIVNRDYSYRILLDRVPYEYSLWPAEHTFRSVVRSVGLLFLYASQNFPDSVAYK